MCDFGRQLASLAEVPSTFNKNNVGFRHELHPWPAPAPMPSCRSVLKSPPAIATVRPTGKIPRGKQGCKAGEMPHEVTNPSTSPPWWQDLNDVADSELSVRNLPPSRIVNGLRLGSVSTCQSFWLPNLTFSPSGLQGPLDPFDDCCRIRGPGSPDRNPRDFLHDHLPPLNKQPFLSRGPSGSTTPRIVATARPKEAYSLKRLGKGSSCPSEHLHRLSG